MTDHQIRIWKGSEHLELSLQIIALFRSWAREEREKSVLHSLAKLRNIGLLQILCALQTHYYVAVNKSAFDILLQFTWILTDFRLSAQQFCSFHLPSTSMSFFTHLYLHLQKVFLSDTPKTTSYCSLSCSLYPRRSVFILFKFCALTLSAAISESLLGTLYSLRNLTQPQSTHSKGTDSIMGGSQQTNVASGLCYSCPYQLQ